MTWPACALHLTDLHRGHASSLALPWSLSALSRASRKVSFGLPPVSRTQFRDIETENHSQLNLNLIGLCSISHFTVGLSVHDAKHTLRATRTVFPVRY